MITQTVAILCVFGLVIGQILFKASSVSLGETGSFFSPKTLILLLSAMLLYGMTSVAWVWVLQKVELGRIYPFMALAFVFVPLASHLVFGERFGSQYYIGVAIIMIGIAITVRA